MAAALAVSLLLGGAFLVVSALHPSPSEKLDHPASPVSDDATAAQVVDVGQTNREPRRTADDVGRLSADVL